MKKSIFLVLVCLSVLSCKKEEQEDNLEPAVNQDVPEFYLNSDRNEPSITVMFNQQDGILYPRDMDVNPVDNRLWIMNKGFTGSEFVIVTDLGESTQTIEKRRDSHSSHFVVNGTALAFSELNTFATSPEIKNTVADASSTFMGPALWSGDLSIFAMVNQSNWDPNKPLGSHLDMLHQSPFSMGILHDKENSYYVLDGWNGNLCYYQFIDDHGPGAEYHADGRINRYSDVKFTRENGIPSHMAKATDQNVLYFCQTSAGKVMRVDVSEAKFSRHLQAPNEILAEYKEYLGSGVKAVASGLQKPSGLAIVENRMFVSEYSSGKILVYDLKSGEKIASLQTGEKGVTGLKLIDGKLWFVSSVSNKVCMIEPR
jgi:hypothetical protein